MAVDRRSIDRAPPPAPPPCRAVGRAGVAVRRARIALSDVARLQATVTDTGISRKELAAVAVALLLPIPLLAASGVGVPLPAAIERGAASLAAGGGSDGAVVGAAPAPAAARTDPSPAVPGRAGSVGGVSRDDTHMVSSVAGFAPGAAAAPPPAPVPSEEHEETTPAETDPPNPPDPHTDDQTPSGDGNGNPSGDAGGDTAEPLSAEPVDSSVEIDVQAAGTAVQLTVTDDGVEVDTGGAADVGAPLELPLAPPTLPLP